MEWMEWVIQIARFLAGAWPILLCAVLLGGVKKSEKFGRRLRRSLRALVIAWGFFALIRIVLSLNHIAPLPLIEEPLSSNLFLAFGLLLIPVDLALVMDERRRSLDAQTIEDLRSLSPSDFENLVAYTYRAAGHRVEVIGGKGDHGIDLIVHPKSGELWVVQCKRYRGRVGEPAVREFYGALKGIHADQGAMVTTGSFTLQAVEWAEGKPLFLYDGETFLRSLKQIRAHQAIHSDRQSLAKKARKPKKLFPDPVVVEPAEAHTPAAPVETQPAENQEQDKAPFTSMREAPRCPQCGAPMTLHTASRGENDSELFYGCSNFPSCRMIITL